MGLFNFIKGKKTETKKENLEVGGKKYEVETTSFGEDYTFTLEELPENYQRFIEQKLAQSQPLIKSYYQGDEANYFNTIILDKVIEKWEKDETENKPTKDEIIDKIGVAFGQGLIKQFDLEWALLKDQYGEDIVVASKEFMMNLGTLSLVNEVLTRKEGGGLNDMKIIFRKALKEAKIDPSVVRRNEQ